MEEETEGLIKYYWVSFVIQIKEPRGEHTPIKYSSGVIDVHPAICISEMKMDNRCEAILLNWRRISKEEAITFMKYKKV